MHSSVGLCQHCNLYVASGLIRQCDGTRDKSCATKICPWCSFAASDDRHLRVCIDCKRAAIQQRSGAAIAAAIVNEHVEVGSDACA
jgi:hypothetical protein